MAKRVAITIAGAVSLGSYEAGVLYELLRAFRTRNEEAGADDSRKVYIDVLTGASAGAMTAAMVGQRLMYDGAALENGPGDEPTNSLYEAWVKRINLMSLVKMGWKEPKWHSLFSSDLIESIGQDMLVDSMRKPGSGPHAAVERVNGSPLPIRLGFALTNMNGIDYMIPIAGSDEGGFNYTTSADQKLFTLSGNREDDAKQWTPLCAAAVASGAFPAAFRAQAIPHSPEEYQTPRLPQDHALWQTGVCYLDWRGKDDRAFAHCDGGVLQNQPLGIAKNLVDEAVKQRAATDSSVNCDSGDRLYVFVSPHSVKSTAEEMQAQKLTIWGELKHLVSVYLRQASFHDWITAEEMNQKITVLDTRAAQLAEVIKHDLVDVAALSKAAGDLNAMLMPNDEAGRLDRLRDQYSASWKDVLDTAGQAAADAYLQALATLEAAAHLEKRDTMKIVAVIASEKELAGAGLAAFLGFFRKKYRQHDYWMGRKKTRTYLARKDVKAILGVEKWPEEDSWAKGAAPDFSAVQTPPSFFSVLSAAIVPGMIFVLLRPVLVITLAVLACLAWWLLHR